MSLISIDRLNLVTKSLTGLIKKVENNVAYRFYNLFHDEVREVQTTEYGDTLTWDGNTDGLVYAIIQYGVYLYHVSDCIPSIENFTDGGVIGTNSQGSLDFTVDNITVETDALLINDQMIIIALADNALDGFLPKKGIYFLYVSSNGIHVSSLTINNYTFTESKEVVVTPLKTIDKKYIPQTADWNETDENAAGYIKNRICHDAVMTTEFISGGTLTWDGNTDGLLRVGDHFRISSTVVSESIIASGGTVSAYGISETFNSSMCGVDADICYIFGKMIIIAPRDNAVDSSGNVYMKAGIYVINSFPDISITFNGYAGGFDLIKPAIPTKQIDLKYIPDECFAEDAVRFTSQSLTDAQKQIARNNIGAGTSSFSGSFNDLTDVNVQPDWNESDSTKNGYIHNKPDSLSDFNIDTLPYVILADKTTNVPYCVTMDNGTLVANVVCVGITVTQLPDKTDYTDTEEFDPTGMIVVATYADGTEKEITDYTYDTYVTTGSDTHTISYNDYGPASTTISITTRTIEEALVDFTYTTNSDGTYIITGWKGTYNGVSSTECILPNSDLIDID